MMKSAKPRKQRFFRFNAPLHMRQHFMHAHLDRPLRSKLKRGSIRISKGDAVKVMAGKKRGATGKVARVDLNRSVIYIEGIIRKDAKGKEFGIPIRPDNVYITEINLSDKKRAAKLKQQQAPAAATRAEKPKHEQVAAPIQS